MANNEAAANYKLLKTISVYSHLWNWMGTANLRNHYRQPVSLWLVRLIGVRHRSQGLPREKREGGWQVKGDHFLYSVPERLHLDTVPSFGAPCSRGTSENQSS